MGGRIPRWESELWSYISSGDGEHCPIYDHCQARLRGGLCISEHKEQLDRLLDSSHFDYRNYDFVPFVTPGRIFELIEMLAEKYVKMGEIRAPPVPTTFVGLFDPRRTVEVRMVPFKTYHGAIWCLKDSWVVQLNENDTPARRRFSLFHEGFHILAHCKATPVFRRRGSERGSFNELLAEYFASCILMPGQWVKEKWAEVKDLGRMTEIFGVPEIAMWARLKTLHLI